MLNVFLKKKWEWERIFIFFNFIIHIWVFFIIYKHRLALYAKRNLWYFLHSALYLVFICNKMKNLKIWVFFNYSYMPTHNTLSYQPKTMVIIVFQMFKMISFNSYQSMSCQKNSWTILKANFHSHNHVFESYMN